MKIIGITVITTYTGLHVYKPWIPWYNQGSVLERIAKKNFIDVSEYIKEHTSEREYR